ncbi:MAG: DUF6119 family protein [Nanoarchaeota archaeon]
MPDEEKDKIQIGIYRIDKSLFGDLTSEAISQTIIENYNRKVSESEKFIEQGLSRTGFEGFSVKVFYSTKVRTPKWRPFLKDILSEDSDLVKGINKDASYIAFISDTQNLYAISGGQGNFTVQDFVDQNFGIEIISRLISKESKVIKSLQDRGVTGTVLGSTKFFRGDHKLSDEDQFGKIYKQIKAELNKKILLEEFGFTEDEIKRDAGCLAKSSFQINKGIDFDTLLRVLGKLTTILSRERQFSLNKVIFLPNRGQKNKEIIKKLETKLSEVLFNHCNSGVEIDFDFSHPDFDKYLTAEKYTLYKGWNSEVVSYDNLDNLVVLLADLKSRNLLRLGNQEEFVQSLSNLKIKSFDGEGKLLTQGSVRDHIHGEIVCDEKTYFLIDDEWYEIQPDFIADLNKDCKELVEQSQDDALLDEVFDINEDENIFNAKFVGKEGYIVLDKITSENIEMCDILKYTDDAVYLIHVKKGFNNSVRDLSSQVLLSAKRILTDIKTGYSFIESIETTLRGRSGSTNEYFRNVSSQTIPTGGIKGIFESKRHKQIYFCFAFVDVARASRLITNPESFESNIAKFSLIELQKEINKEGFGFSIVQIGR